MGPLQRLLHLLTGDNGWVLKTMFAVDVIMKRSMPKPRPKFTKDRSSTRRPDYWSTLYVGLPRIIGIPCTRGCLGCLVMDHVEVGAVDGPSEVVVKRQKIPGMYTIVVSAEEGRAPKRLQIHNSSGMPNTNITTP